MKAVSGKKMCKALERNGWVQQRIRGSHHIYAHPSRPDILIVPVHANRDLKVALLAKLLKQAGLTEADV